MVRKLILSVCLITNLAPQLSLRFSNGVTGIQNNLPVAMLIPVCYGGFGRRVDPYELINTSLLAAHEPGDVPGTSASGNVTERHSHKVIPGIVLFGVSVGIVSLDDGRKYCRAYQVIDKLRAQW